MYGFYMRNCSHGGECFPVGYLDLSGRVHVDEVITRGKGTSVRCANVRFSGFVPEARSIGFGNASGI